MQPHTRKILDRSFTLLGFFSILVMACALVLILYPIISRGLGAYIFRATCEHRRVMFEQFEVGSAADIARETTEIDTARKPVFDMLAAYENDLKAGLNVAFDQVRSACRDRRWISGTLA